LKLLVKKVEIISDFLISYFFYYSLFIKRLKKI
jgi:hypothetical protein